jgi:hypothetical protein
MSETFIVATGTPDNHGLELDHIEDGLYGLIYTGFWHSKAWCYVAIGPNAAVFCQPLDQKNGAVGTSITNIWSQRFILAVAALTPIGPRPLYEYYFDEADRHNRLRPWDNRTPEISRVTYRPTVSGHDPIKWEFTGKTFAEIIGRPEPDFRNLAWGREAAARCRKHNDIATVEK